AALPDLRKALREPDEDLRRYAAMALGGLGKQAEPGLPDLVDVVANRSEKPKVRVEAATALNRIGLVKGAKEAVPMLVRVLDNPDESPKVRERVIWALRVHNRDLRNLPGVMPALAKILSEPRRRDEDGNPVKMLYFDSAYMLGMLQGPEAPPKTLDVLLDFLRDKDILIYFGLDPKIIGSTVEGVAADVKVKETGMGDGRLLAGQALRNIGSSVGDHGQIVAELRAITANPSLWSKLREEASTCLKNLGK